MAGGWGLGARDRGLGIGGSVEVNDGWRPVVFGWLFG